MTLICTEQSWPSVRALPENFRSICWRLGPSAEKPGCLDTCRRAWKRGLPPQQADVLLREKHGHSDQDHHQEGNLKLLEASKNGFTEVGYNQDLAWD